MAQEEMEKFIQHHLKELQSQQEMRHLVVELSSKTTAHQTRVCQVLCSECLRHAKVAQLVLVGMADDRPLESNFFPAFWRDCWGGSAMLPLERVSLPLHPEKVLAAFGHQPCMRRFYGWSIEKWRHQDLPGCLNAWISIMRRISSKSKVIRCQRSSQTCFSSHHG